jgi:hypothetical protein
MIAGLFDAFRMQVTTDAMNPEVFEPEAEDTEVDMVALKKTETLRKNLSFKEDERTLLVAFDVATFLGSEEELDAGAGEDLKRLMRQVDLTDGKEGKEKWEEIMAILQAEKVRTIERCAHGAFSIEWHIGFAINSNDGVISNRAALVLRASFNALSPEVILQAFRLSDELDDLRKAGTLPTAGQLTSGVKALAIGPRLPFAELLGEKAQLDSLTLRNRDYPELPAVKTSPEVFLSLVRDCALPPQACLELLANSWDDSDAPKSPLEKKTVPVTQVT